jgi:hypothetical protein
MVRYGLIARYPRPAPSTVIEYRLTYLGKCILEMVDTIEQLDKQLKKGPPAIEQDFGMLTNNIPDRPEVEEREVLKPADPFSRIGRRVANHAK